LEKSRAKTAQGRKGNSAPPCELLGGVGWASPSVPGNLLWSLTITGRNPRCGCTRAETPCRVIAAHLFLVVRIERADLGADVLQIGDVGDGGEVFD
jgi:hypothetical protein